MKEWTIFWVFTHEEAVLASGGATLGPKGALAPLPPPQKYLKKLVYIYIYSRVTLIKKCYIHNIFTINLK